MSEPLNGIGLGELINKVKQELAATSKENPVFIVENVDLELQVTISKAKETKAQGEAKADFKINILTVDLFKLGELKGSAEATEKINRENIHKIKITLSPAIFHKEYMDNISPEESEKVKKASYPYILQGDDDDII